MVVSSVFVDLLHSSAEYDKNHSGSLEEEEFEQLFNVVLKREEARSRLALRRAATRPAPTPTPYDKTSIKM